jgi:acyl phosphate:glycerol-3-phosphate acyltransferase
LISIGAPLLFGYAIGCINTGYYLVRVRTGRDLRAEGSGTAGATNAGRLLVRQGFALAMAGDTIKGALAVLAVRWLGGDDPAAAAAVGAVLGHIYPVQLRFRGGKGLATALGAGAALAPLSALVAAIVALVVLAASHRQVISALSGVAAAPLSAFALRGPDPLAVGLAVMAVVIFLRHVVPPRSTLSVGGGGGA